MEVCQTRQPSKHDAGEDWGNDDAIFEDILDVQNVVEVSRSHSKTLQQGKVLSVSKEKLVHHHTVTRFLDNTIDSPKSRHSPQENTIHFHWHDKPVQKGIEKPAAKFPGPAGLLSLTTVCVGPSCELKTN